MGEHGGLTDLQKDHPAIYSAQRSVKFIHWLKSHLNTRRTWVQALASTHLVPQTKEAGVTNAGATGFPLNPLGLFGSEFDIRARAHPTARHGTNKIFPT